MDETSVKGDIPDKKHEVLMLLFPVFSMLKFLAQAQNASHIHVNNLQIGG
jgi:hypothetical protein